MSGSPYVVTVATTDDQSFRYTLPLELEDGSDFPFADYTFEYAIQSCGRQMHLLTEGTGITVTAPNVEFKLTDPLRVGTYDHACRVRHITSGDLVQVFTGQIVVTQGFFQ